MCTCVNNVLSTNTGLEAVQPTFWVAFFLLSGVAEAWRMLAIAENPMV